MQPKRRPGGCLSGAEEAVLGAAGLDAPLASPVLRSYSPDVSYVLTCAQRREKVLEADLLGDEEECLP